MKILAIETSCDETSSAVVEKKENDNCIKVLSNIVSSSLPKHAKTGGIIPENAAREQVKYILPVIIESLLKSEKIDKKLNDKQRFEQANKILKENIDALTVTVGPGLIGSLLVGVETAKTLSFTFGKPIVPVNHLLGHIYANFIYNQKLASQIAGPSFPFIGLIVSGGHTDLLFFENHGKYKWLGGTRDDAAGEAMDKLARILGLSYPGGPQIEKKAKKVNKSNIKFKSPMIETEDFDFSFSGLKTEAMREIQKIDLNDEIIDNICFAIQKAIVDVLIKKTVRAAKVFNVSTIVLGGGVSANESLRERFLQTAKDQRLKTKVFFPEKKYTSDNAAMIGSYALFNYKPVPWKKITAKPELYFI